MRSAYMDICSLFGIEPNKRFKRHDNKVLSNFILLGEPAFIANGHPRSVSQKVE